MYVCFIFLPPLIMSWTIVIIAHHFFSHDILAHYYALPYQVWLQKVEQFWTYLLDKTQTHGKTDSRTDGHGDSSIPPNVLTGGIKRNGQRHQIFRAQEQSDLGWGAVNSHSVVDKLLLQITIGGFLGTVFLTVFHTIETGSCKVHKLLCTGEVPSTLTSVVLVQVVVAVGLSCFWRSECSGQAIHL